jgi:hypothetical protein
VIETFLSLCLSLQPASAGIGTAPEVMHLARDNARERVIEILRSLRDPEHAAPADLALLLLPYANEQLPLLAKILKSRKVPGGAGEAQSLSEVQRDVLLMTIGMLEPARAREFFLERSGAGLAEGQMLTRVELLGALGDRAQLEEVFEIANQTWLGHPGEGSSEETLKREERAVLGRALHSILARDEGSFNHIKQRWSLLHPELKTEILLAAGSSAHADAGGVLALVLKVDDPLAGLAIGQVKKLGGFIPLQFRSELRGFIRPFLSGDSKWVSEACQTLGTLGDTDSIGQLVELLEHEQPKVRDAAHWGLGQITGLSFAKDGSRWRFWHAREKQWTLANLDKTLQELRSGKPERAAHALATLVQHPLAHDALDRSVIDLIRGRNPQLKLLGIRMASERRLPEELPHLIELFDDSDQSVREAAWAAACTLSGLDAVPGSKLWREFLGLHSYLVRG